MLKQIQSYSNSAYRTAMNHPKTSTAVMLGTGVATALIWAARRNGGFKGLYNEVLERVRR
jgi:hypothetical protein